MMAVIQRRIAVAAWNLISILRTPKETQIGTWTLRRRGGPGRGIEHETEQDKVKHSEYLAHRYGLEAVSGSDITKPQEETKTVPSASTARADRIRERRQQKQNKGNKDDS